MLTDLRHLIQSSGGWNSPAHREGGLLQLLRSAKTQVFSEFEGLLSLVSELDIRGSSFEGRLWSLAWAKEFCGMQSKGR